MANKDLRVKKQGQHAEVHLVSGTTLSGKFFLSGQAQSRLGSETLMDVFNDSQRVYLPFTEGESEAFHLLNKQHIVMVELQEYDLAQVLGFDSEEGLPTRSVRLSFGHQDSSVSGEAYVGDLHPDNRRLTDLLNHGASFFLLLSEERLYLVNKRQMHFAVVG